MGQILHGSANMTETVRRAIQEGRMFLFRILLSIYSIICCFCCECFPSPLIKGYSHVNISRSNKPACKGILIDKFVFAAAHCFTNRGKEIISAVQEGHVVSESPTHIIFAPAYPLSQEKRDLAAVYVPNLTNADVDGQVNLDASFSLNEMTFKKDDQFFFEKKNIISVINSYEFNEIRIVPLYYGRTYTQLVEFALPSPPKISVPSVDRNGTAKFSLSMQNEMFQSADDLLCQGQSGSPIFYTSSGSKYLFAIIVKGKPNSYINNVMCGTNVYALRMDSGALIWINNILMRKLQ